MSFMRFLGLSLADRVPDARTIWLFREKLTKAGAIEPLFGSVGCGGPTVTGAITPPKVCRLFLRLR
jgi:IS5 family transposase